MNKKLMIVGGANGVGKSTLAYKIRDEFGIDYLGADDIAMKMKNSSANTDIKAGKEFFRILEEYLSLEKSLIIESTLSGLGLANRIESFIKCGYSVNITYVFVDNVNICKDRISLRVKKGGHSVPDEDIERRFYRSLKNFNNVYKMLAGKWQIFYNGLNHPVEVAAGENDGFIIYDEFYYNIFRELKQ